MHQLLFERGKEAFHHGVVPAVAFLGNGLIGSDGRERACQRVHHLEREAHDEEMGEVQKLINSTSRLADTLWRRIG